MAKHVWNNLFLESKCGWVDRHFTSPDFSIEIVSESFSGKVSNTRISVTWSLFPFWSLRRQCNVIAWSMVHFRRSLLKACMHSHWKPELHQRPSKHGWPRLKTESNGCRGFVLNHQYNSLLMIVHTNVRRNSPPTTSCQIWSSMHILVLVCADPPPEIGSTSSLYWRPNERNLKRTSYQVQLCDVLPIFHCPEQFATRKRQFDLLSSFSGSLQDQKPGLTIW